MITRIEIDGFKSLRDFAVDLEPITVFIGPNNAGKSNILEAIALLSRLSSMPIDEAFKRGRGRAAAQFTRSGSETGRRIRLAVELLLPWTSAGNGTVVPNRCRYELAIERRSRPSGSEYLAIEHESLWMLDRASDTWIDMHADLEDYVCHAPEKDYLFEHVSEDGRERLVRVTPRIADLDELRIPAGHTSLAALPNWPDVSKMDDELQSKLIEVERALGERSLIEDLGLLWVRLFPTLIEALSGEPRQIRTMAAKALSAFHLLHLVPAALRASSTRIGPETLASDGSNLAVVLANLPAPVVGEIRADIVSVVPGLSSFEIVPDGDELRIEFTLTGGERLPAELTSDGTLRILALLTALRVQPRPSAIGVDELENGIYPGRLRRLLELMQETIALTDESEGESSRQLPVQLLLTTHSPVMLDAFRSRLECLRFVDLVRRDKQIVTRARPVRPEVGEDRGRLAVSLREVDQLLQAADSEMASST